MGEFQTALLAVLVEVNSVVKAGAEVSIDGTDKAQMTGPGALILFRPMWNGGTRCRIACDGYAEQLVTLALAAGVRKIITVTLQPLFEGTLKVGSETVTAPQLTAWKG